MSINYIYSPAGEAEFAVIPIEIWELVKAYVPQNVLDDDKMPTNSTFDPNEYMGMLSHLELDIEMEITNMRSEWVVSNI